MMIDLAYLYYSIWWGGKKGVQKPGFRKSGLKEKPLPG